MDELTILDHTEWWIAYENYYDLDDHGVIKCFSESGARMRLITMREAHTGRRYVVHEVKVHRVATRLDW